MKIHVGDILSVKPSIYFNKDGGCSLNKHIRGKVIYVNKRHRYFTVEYQLAGGRIREAFKM